MYKTNYAMNVSLPYCVLIFFVVTAVIIVISVHLNLSTEATLLVCGRTPIWNRRGCSSEILNLTLKGDHLGVAQAFCDP